MSCTRLFILNGYIGWTKTKHPNRGEFINPIYKQTHKNKQHILKPSKH